MHCRWRSVLAALVACSVSQEAVAGAVADDDDREALLRMNCGSTKDFTDTHGNVWYAETGFSGGSRGQTGSDIDGTDEDGLYQTERYGNPFSYAIPIEDGTYEVTLHHAEIFFTDDDRRVFDGLVEGDLFLDEFDIHATVGPLYAVQTSVVAWVDDGVMDLLFTATKNNAQVCGIEVYEHDSGHPYLHAVIDGPSSFVDYRGVDSAEVTLNGEDSHTHEFGRSIVRWKWEVGGEFHSWGPNFDAVLPIGHHVIDLTVYDDNSPPETLTDFVSVDVYKIDRVGGVLTSYFDRANDSVNLRAGDPVYMEVLPEFLVEAVNSKIGNSPLTSNVRMQWAGQVEIQNDGNYEFVLMGAWGQVFVDGQVVRGPRFLSSGLYDVGARFSVDSASDLPVELQYKVNGASPTSIPSNLVTHDETALRPFLNPFRSSGSTLGGEPLEITGLGFFPWRRIRLMFGSENFGYYNMEITPTTLNLFTPAGVGKVDVQVASGRGRSNIRPFYFDQDVPVEFETSTIASLNAPSAMAWGPDERLYVGAVSGEILAYSFDDDWNVLDVKQMSVIKKLNNNNLLSLAFNPLDPPDPPRLYAVHSKLYGNGGDCFTGTSWYSGQVSVIEGPDFESLTPLVTGLPVSNHDHSVNSGAFDEHGDFYLAVGGNTNAGVEHCKSGGLPESPLSASIVKIAFSDPDFDGAVTYIETDTGLPNDDQVYGGVVDVPDGVSVTPYATGIRNAFDFVLTTRGDMMLCDNGPNDGYGKKSEGKDKEGPDPSAKDEFMRIAEGAYYGHPNRNRGRTEDRENYYRHPNDSPILGQYASPWHIEKSSLVGMMEYRGANFGGSLYGAVLFQRWNKETYAVWLDEHTGEMLDLQMVLGGPIGLDIVQGPGGVILGTDYTKDEVTISRPVDQTVGNFTIFDIFPRRAPAAGGVPFVIGGVGFGDIADSHVTIGGLDCVLTSVSPTRIRGIIPAALSPSAELLDVHAHDHHIDLDSEIHGAFRYLLDPGQGVGAWDALPDAPDSVGEVTCAAIGGVLYMFGEGSKETYALDLASGIWQNSAGRPFVGHHIASEVIDGKWYLFGGINAPSGKVQIYDPIANTWTRGADIPVDSGSASTALIDGKVYYAGGILPSDTTTDQAAVYDPALDQWTSIAPMPAGRNHAASGTDGALFYVFGGRGPGSGDDNSVAPGFDTVQVYDPATDTWESSDDTGSSWPALPQKRGGMGKAAVYRGELYVIGGETTDQSVPGGVYDRVDVFNPITRTWRLEAPMPTARHGIFPVVIDRRLWVTGGGVKSAHSSSAIVERFHR